jgi:hypothetical protein
VTLNCGLTLRSFAGTPDQLNQVTVSLNPTAVKLLQGPPCSKRFNKSLDSWGTVLPIFDMLAVIFSNEWTRMLNQITLHSELQWIDSDFLGIMRSFCYCLTKTVKQIIAQLIKEFNTFLIKCSFPRSQQPATGPILTHRNSYRFWGSHSGGYESSIFYFITPCSPFKINRRFGGTCHLHIQSWRIYWHVSGAPWRIIIDSELDDWIYWHCCYNYT